eukprot:TRINITY_DN22582_c0_g1_i1.p1 TRINITY_DN22582_c0_g1~~TRINITY_DN22582_c0_g1_i1.p1  ORF type:complete len:451 (+),score=84.61 TRINITY_DN22582_c0_g1_i1:40-1392(+)
MGLREHLSRTARTTYGSSVSVHVHLKQTVLLPGNVLEGYVEMVAHRNVTLHAVRLKVTGKETVVCRRRVGREGHDQGAVRVYRKSNIAFKQLITLAGAMKSWGDSSFTALPAGRYTYPFAFHLPPILPPSFAESLSDDSASLSYTVKAYVDLPQKREAMNAKPFVVLKPVPLSQWLEPQPACMEAGCRVMICGCIPKGTVRVWAFMDRTLLAVDRDDVTVRLEVDNTEGTELVEGVDFSLQNVLTYKAHGLSEQETRFVAHQHLKQFVPAGEKGMIMGAIHLPRELIPTLKLWNVTNTYQVQVALTIPGASDLGFQFPVTVVQTIDTSSESPALRLKNDEAYKMVARQGCPETYYQPPPEPVFACALLAFVPPPNAQLCSYGSKPSVPLPSVAWGSPGTAPAVPWGSGFGQKAMPNRPLSLPPEDVGKYAAEGAAHRASNSTRLLSGALP